MTYSFFSVFKRLHYKMILTSCHRAGKNTKTSNLFLPFFQNKQKGALFRVFVFLGESVETSKKGADFLGSFLSWGKGEGRGVSF